MCCLGRTQSARSFHSPCTKHLESGTQPKCYRLIWWNKALDLWLMAVHLCQALFGFPTILSHSSMGLGMSHFKIMLRCFVLAKRSLKPIAEQQLACLASKVPRLMFSCLSQQSNVQRHICKFAEIR